MFKIFQVLNANTSGFNRITVLAHNDSSEKWPNSWCDGVVLEVATVPLPFLTNINSKDILKLNLRKQIKFAKNYMISLVYTPL